MEDVTTELYVALDRTGIGNVAPALMELLATDSNVEVNMRIQSIFGNSYEILP